MSVQTEAWVLYGGEKGAKPTTAELVRESFDFAEPGPQDVLVAPLFGCMEGNMGHALQRRPIDLCLARGEERVVIGNAGVVRVEAIGSEVTTVKQGDEAIVFCNGESDAYGYPRKIFAYDAEGSVGMLAKTSRFHQHQLIPLPSGTRHGLQQWAAFSLRYVTAWSNWELAYGTLRLLLPEEELPRPFVWGWGGGVTLGELALAKHFGCDATQIASTDERLATIESLGIRPVDRREFSELFYDKARFKKDEDYTKAYLSAEKTFLSRVRDITGGEMVNVFIDFVGAPVFRATLKALARQGVVTTAGWKEG
ncbi:MAG: zinc-binding dehydrogenase, partial [Candidatus Binatia bacterium]